RFRARDQNDSGAKMELNLARLAVGASLGLVAACTPDFASSRSDRDLLSGAGSAGADAQANPGAASTPGAAPVSSLLATADQARKLERQPDGVFTTTATAGDVDLEVDDTYRYQTMDGFGAAITDTSAWLLFTKLSSAQRDQVMRQV